MYIYVYLCIYIYIYEVRYLQFRFLSQIFGPLNTAGLWRATATEVELSVAAAPQEASDQDQLVDSIP